MFISTPLSHITKCSLNVVTQKQFSCCKSSITINWNKKSVQFQIKIRFSSFLIIYENVYSWHILFKILSFIPFSSFAINNNKFVFFHAYSVILLMQGGINPKWTVRICLMNMQHLKEGIAFIFDLSRSDSPFEFLPLRSNLRP